MREAAIWMRRRNGAIPDHAFIGEPFDIGGGGDHPAQAVNLDFNGGRIWAASLDDPDKNVIGRTWVTEITVAEYDMRVQFGARLINVTRRANEPFVPSLPGVVRQLIKRRPATADGLTLGEAPVRVVTDEEVDDLIALLDDPARRMPVLVLADGVTRDAFAPPDALAQRLAGAAHVYNLAAEASWELTRRVGKALSVFDGAARLYRTGFRSESADPFQHPLWMARAGSAPDGRENAVIGRVLSAGVNARNRDDYPRFNAIRQAAAATEIAARRSTSTSAEIVHLFEEENERLNNELKALRSEFDQWLEETDSAQSKLESEISELKSEISRARAQNDSLRAALSSGHANTKRTDLSEYTEFDAWSKANISTNIWIAPKAVKEVEKNGEFDDPSVLGKALFMLDDFYVPMRRDPSPERRAAYEARLQELCCEDQPCFTDKNVIKGYAEYGVNYQGERFWCDRHIKHGGGTDPKRFFRIYFHWDDEEQILLIGHLPTHLDNRLTN